MPITKDSIGGQPPQILGQQCPLCDSASPIAYMKFRDPHGVDRIDSEVFECAAQRHTFTLTNSGMRVLAADGVLQKPSAEYVFSHGTLRAR